MNTTSTFTHVRLNEYRVFVLLAFVRYSVCLGGCVFLKSSVPQKNTYSSVLEITSQNIHRR